MIKLFIVKCFRKLSYDKTISSLTEEEAILLSFLDENDQIILPSGGTLHHFVKYRLGEEGINEVMMLLGEKILQLSSEKEAKIVHRQCANFSVKLEILKNYRIENSILVDQFYVPCTKT